MYPRAIIGAVAASFMLILGACASHKAQMVNQASTANSATGKTRAVLVGDARAAKKNDQLVCIRHTKTGTHIAKVYCMTHAQYEAYKKETRKSGQQFQDTVNRAPTPKCNDPACGGDRVRRR